MNFNLITIVFVMILYATEHRVMGLYWLRLSGISTFGRSTNTVLLIVKSNRFLSKASKTIL